MPGDNVETSMRSVVIDLDDDPYHGIRPLENQKVYPKSKRLPESVVLVAGRWNIGLTAYAAGLDVHVVDRRGLSDPIASRLQVRARGRPGCPSCAPRP